MSQPIEAEPGAAAETDPAPTAPTQPTSPGPNDPVDISSLPANVQKLITGLRTENASSRTKAKTTAAEEARTAVLKQIGEALGITDGTPDPAKLTEQLTRSQEDAVTAQIELQVLRTASRLGANADRLLDSLSFRDKVDALDPAGDFGQQLQDLITAEVASNPVFSTAPRNPAPDPSQGRGGNAGPTDFRQVGQDEFAAELAKYGLRTHSRS